MAEQAGNVTRTESEEAEKATPGKRLVRARLVEPLRAVGMRRPHRMRQKEFEAMIERIVDRLKWAPAEILDTLCDMAQREAGGQGLRADAFPSEAGLMNAARNLAKAQGVVIPNDQARKVTSYMQSAAGRAALERSIYEAMALYRYLTNHRGVPGQDAHSREKIDDYADQYQRTHRRVASEIEAGVDQASARQWIAWFNQRRDLVEGLVRGHSPAELG